MPIRRTEPVCGILLMANTLIIETKGKCPTVKLMLENYSITRDDYKTNWNILRSQFMATRPKRGKIFFLRLLRKSVYYNAHP